MQLDSNPSELTHTGPAVTAPATDRLDSWKEIARYLNKECSHSQRWKKTDELPVHRHLSAKHGSVSSVQSRDPSVVGKRPPSQARTP